MILRLRDVTQRHDDASEALSVLREELRSTVLEAYHNRHMTKRVLARFAGISRSTLDKWIADETQASQTSRTNQKEHDA